MCQVHLVAQSIILKKVKSLRWYLIFLKHRLEKMLENVALLLLLKINKTVYGTKFRVFSLVCFDFGLFCIYCSNIKISCRYHSGGICFYHPGIHSILLVFHCCVCLKGREYEWVCVWVCTCVCMCVSVYMCVHVCVYVYVHLHVSMHEWMCMCTIVCMFVYVCMCMCMCVCVCMCVLLSIFSLFSSSYFSEVGGVIEK